MSEPSSIHDRGIVTPVEMMFVLVFALVALAFLGFVGRLHAAGVQVTNTAQAAARSASLEASRDAAVNAAQDIVASSTLTSRCTTPPTAALAWTPSPIGTWHGGSLTVTVSCTIDNAALTGVWTPGSRTISVSDTQPIDRYDQ
jgi:Flp pilus assembly protein TadG